MLSNAIKYSSENSSININSFEKDKEVLIEIIDEGIGMDVEKIQELMSNEVETTVGTAGEKGTGLGIFLIRELLQKINGSLLIESKKGKGSVFTIKLPSVNS